MTEAAKQAYRYRFYPTPAQAENLDRTFGCVRLVYNKALDARVKAWYRRKERISYVETSALLTKWKRRKDFGFLNEVSAVPLQQALRHLQAGYANFWEGRAGHPSFKRKRISGSAEYTKSAFTWRRCELKLAKHDEPLRIKWSRPLPSGSQPSTVTVTRDRAGRWFVSFLVEAAVRAAPASDAAVGVDAGLSSLLTHCPRARRSPTRAMSAATGTGSVAVRGISFASRRAARILRRRQRSSPGRTRGFRTGVSMRCTSSPLDWFAKTK